MPRLAHYRTVPFFWPMRASSWNHSSTFVRGGRSQRCAFSVRGQFFELLDDMGIPCRMLRARAQSRKAEPVQQFPDIAGVVVHAEALLDDALQVDAPPANDTVNGTVRTLSTIAASSVCCSGDSRDGGPDDH